MSESLVQPDKPLVLGRQREPVPSETDDEVLARARVAVQRIVKGKQGAWGGVLLQQEWMASVIADAMKGTFWE
jgi:hypothetical protein